MEDEETDTDSPRWGRFAFGIPSWQGLNMFVSSITTEDSSLGFMGS